MPIHISKTGAAYVGQVLSADRTEVTWTSDAPMAASALIAALRSVGCHQTDIGDAFYAADPEWALRIEDADPGNGN